MFSGVNSCPRTQCVLRALRVVGVAGLRSMFSRFVSRRRCVGFTHSFWQQMWSTTMPSGMGPLCISNETLWAYSGLRSAPEIRP